VPSVGVGAYLDEKFYCDYAREEIRPCFLEYSELDGTGVASSSILSRVIWIGVESLLESVLIGWMKIGDGFLTGFGISTMNGCLKSS